MGPWEISFPLLIENVHREPKGLMGVTSFWEESCVFTQLWLCHLSFHREKAAMFWRQSVVEIQSGKTHPPFWRYRWIEIWRLSKQAELECPVARSLPIHSHHPFIPSTIICSLLPWSHKLIFTPEGEKVKEIDRMLSYAWESVHFVCEPCGSRHSESSCHSPRENPYGQAWPFSDKLLFLNPGWNRMILILTGVKLWEFTNKTARSDWKPQLSLSQIHFNLVFGKYI